MQKELIVSSNRLETKAAILEDGQVMELFIERSETKGILGNIYKGRVTRVLPGMQSAFVDIGLERDTFLYVSDFFEETDEYERLYTTPQDQSSPSGEQRSQDRGGDRQDRGPRRRDRNERQRPGGPRPPQNAIELPANEVPEALTAAMETADELPGDSEVRAALEEWFTGNHLDSEGRPSTEAENQAPVETAPTEVQSTFESPLDTGDMAVPASIPEPSPRTDTVARWEAENVSFTPPSMADEIPFKTEENPVPPAAIITEAVSPADASPDADPNLEAKAERETGDPVPSPGRKEPGEQRERRSRSSSYRGRSSRNRRPHSSARTTSAEPSASSESAEPIVPKDMNAEQPVEKESSAEEATLLPPKRESDFESRPHRRPGGNRRRGGNSRHHTRSDKGDFPPRQTISDLLKEGQEIMVQVAKEPIARKGARVTSYVALPGRFLVYMPTVEHVGVSRKIDSEAERQRLRRLMTELRANIPGGFIVRTACEGRTREEIETDIKYLHHVWEEVRAKYEKASAPAHIHREMGLVQKILRDQLSDEFRMIRVDDEEEYERILDFLHRYQPSFINRVKLFTKDADIFDEYGVSNEINRAMESKIWLKSGGYIVINQTEALVAIDVNTGKFVGKGDNLEDTITRTNMDAVKEVVRQIRLRDLGGIIVIDFIDMEERKNRYRVMELLQQEIAQDKAPSKVLEFNEFGLVAITRKRVKQSLEKTFCQPCAYCNGSGMVKSLTTVCYQIHAEIQKIRRHMDNEREISVRVHPDVARALRGTEAKVLEEIELLLGRELSLKQDPTLHVSQFDIIS